MERSDVILLMKLITNVYQNFEVEDPAKIDVWYMVLQDTPIEDAKRNLMTHFRTNSFPPTPADLIRENKQRQPSFYELQRAEEEADRLALAEYNEKAVPMPEHIRLKLEQTLARKKVSRK